MKGTAQNYATEGEVIDGKYRLGSPIATGSMGLVLAARHVELDESVAIKVLHPNLASPRFSARFLREARNAMRIKSEHVPRYLDAGRLKAGLPYLVMEYLEGQTLARVLERGTRIATREAVDYVLQACEAVAAAHLIGVVHRDLKPSNLFLTTRLDGSPLIKVLDFGVSRVANSTGEQEDEGLTVANVTLGALDFRAPEQFVNRDVDARCDVWAMGAILYHLVAGRAPFAAKTGQEIVKKILQADPDPPSRYAPDLSPDLDAAILRCLMGNREDRPPTMAALAVLLQDFGSERTRGLAASIVAAEKRASRGAISVRRDIAAPELPAALRSATEGEGYSRDGQGGKARGSEERGGWRPERVAAAFALALVVGLSLLVARRGWLEGRARTASAADSITAATARMPPTSESSHPTPEAPHVAPVTPVPLVLPPPSQRAVDAKATSRMRPAPKPSPTPAPRASATASDPWGWDR